MARRKHTKEEPPSASTEGASPKSPADAFREAMDAKYRDMTMDDLARHMYKCEVALEIAKVQTSKIQAEYDYLRLTALPARAEDDGVDSITIRFSKDYTARLGFTGDLYASLVDKSRGFEWLRDNGHGGLITETVNAQSLKAAMKTRIEKAEGMPPAEIIKLVPFKRATLTKVSK